MWLISIGSITKKTFRYGIDLLILLSVYLSKHVLKVVVLYSMSVSGSHISHMGVSATKQNRSELLLAIIEHCFEHNYLEVYVKVANICPFRILKTCNAICMTGDNECIIF